MVARLGWHEECSAPNDVAPLSKGPISNQHSSAACGIITPTQRGQRVTSALHRTCHAAAPRATDAVEDRETYLFLALPVRPLQHLPPHRRPQQRRVAVAAAEGLQALKRAAAHHSADLQDNKQTSRGAGCVVGNHASSGRRSPPGRMRPGQASRGRWPGPPTWPRPEAAAGRGTQEGARPPSGSSYAGRFAGTASKALAAMCGMRRASRRGPFRGNGMAPAPHAFAPPSRMPPPLGGHGTTRATAGGPASRPAGPPQPHPRPTTHHVLPAYPGLRVLPRGRVVVDGDAVDLDACVHARCTAGRGARARAGPER